MYKLSTVRSFEYICRSYGVNYRHQFTVYIITFTKAKKIKLPPKSATDKKLSKQTWETWNLYCSVYWSEVICSIMAKHKMAKSFHLKMCFAFWNENIITFLSKLMPDPFSDKNLLTTLVTDDTQNRRGQALLFSFGYIYIFTTT